MKQIVVVGILASWLLAVYALVRIKLPMPSIPFLSWFPFGIWKSVEIRKQLGTANEKYLKLIKFAIILLFGSALLSFFDR